MTTTNVTSAKVLAGSAGLPGHVAQRMRDTAVERLGELSQEVEARTETWPGGPGCMLGIELPTGPAPTFFFALGEKGKPAEMVAHEAAEQVEKYLQTQPLGVDEHSADQLLLPLALAEGTSEFRVAAVSSHLVTNAEIIGHFVKREILIDGEEGTAGFVRIA
jgi:RNA 3'-terminal phosphate cyclase (ATP)